MASIADAESGATVRTKLNNTGLRLHNFAGTTAPTANEDTGDGYEVGSIWVDTTNDRAYIAADVTSTAAVWIAIPSAAEMAAKAAALVTQNAQTGTSYTLVLADADKTVTMSNASANVLTVPTNASVAFPVGTTLSVIMLGAGVTTITGDTGVTINGASAGSGAISAQYGGVSLLKIATDTWLAQGAHGAFA